MAGYRMSLPCGLLLAALLLSCDSPIEPISFTEDGANAAIKLNPPSNPRAETASHSQITVSWQDNSGNENGFEVHRSTAGASGTFQLWGSTEAGAISFLDGGLTPSTEYCYKVLAFRKTGNKVSTSTFSSAVCATTSIAPRSAAPSGVTAMPQFAGYRIIITWADNSIDEIGFRVERSIAAGPWAAIGTMGANETSFQDNQSLAVEQEACYRVFAVNVFGDSDDSNVDCTIVPKAPTDLAATVLADGTVNLTWSDNTTLEDGYEVLRGGGGGEGLSVIATLVADRDAYRDVGLADGAHAYVVRATKNGATSSNSNFLQVVVATVLPNAPTNVQASPAGSTVANVSWVDAATNEDSSRIERSTDHGSSWVTAGTVGWYLLSGSFQDFSLTPEHEVCYKVTTINRIGESVSPMACTTPPAGPTDLTATFVDWDVVDFAWTDNSNVEDGYDILIDFGFGYYGGYWGVVGSVGVGETTFRLEGYSGAAYQTYFVAAKNDGGYSDFSSAASPPLPSAASSLRMGSPSRLLTRQRAARPAMGPVPSRRP